jgi:hypothetical protein
MWISYSLNLQLKKDRKYHVIYENLQFPILSFIRNNIVTPVFLPHLPEGIGNPILVWFEND